MPLTSSNHRVLTTTPPTALRPPGPACCVRAAASCNHQPRCRRSKKKKGKKKQRVKKKRKKTQPKESHGESWQGTKKIHARERNKREDRPKKTFFLFFFPCSPHRCIIPSEGCRIVQTEQGRPQRPSRRTPREGCDRTATSIRAAIGSRRASLVKASSVVVSVESS